MNVVGQSVACQENGIPRPQFDRGSDVDAHLIGTDKVGHEVSFLVVQRLALAEKSGFDGKAGWRVDHRLRFDAAPLPDDDRLRVADLVCTRNQTLDRDHGHRRRGAVADVEYGLIHRFDAVKYGRAKQH